MQNTKKYAKFMLALGALAITAAPALAKPVEAPKKELGTTDCQPCKKNKNNKKAALKKACKKGVNPYLIAKCCAKQVKHNKIKNNPAKVAIAKYKLNKQFFGKKAKFGNKAKCRKKAFKPVINKARPQNKKEKAKGFFKNLFTGFLGMNMGK